MIVCQLDGGIKRTDVYRMVRKRGLFVALQDQRTYSFAVLPEEITGSPPSSPGSGLQTMLSLSMSPIVDKYKMYKQTTLSPKYSITNIYCMDLRINPSRPPHTHSSCTLAPTVRIL